jgi:hypothetical protein
LEDRRDVGFDEATKFANDNQIVYTECSAKRYSVFWLNYTMLLIVDIILMKHLLNWHELFIENLSMEGIYMLQFDLSLFIVSDHHHLLYRSMLMMIIIQMEKNAQNVNYIVDKIVQITPSVHIISTPKLWFIVGGRWINLFWKFTKFAYFMVCNF